MNNKQEEILIRTIEKNGCLNQCDMMIEECAELIQAINKIKRLNGIFQDSIRKPNNDSSIKYSLAYNNLCSEIADVRIVLKQMEFMLDEEQIDLIEERKIQKLEKILNSSEKIIQ